MERYELEWEVMNELAAKITTAAPLIVSGAILVAGVVDDLRTRKFHNELFLACCAAAVTVVLATGGWSALYLSLLGFGAGVAVLLPLVLLNMVGAGDMKLLAAFGIAAGWNAAVSVAVLSLFWGALFGFVRVLVNGEGKLLLANMVSIVSMKNRRELTLHRMPYSFALFVGWLTYLVHSGVLCP